MGTALQTVGASYDMTQHYTSGSRQAGAMTDELIDAFGIVGPATYCVERILELHELGVELFMLQIGVAGSDREEMDASRRRVVEQVIPMLR
jgi:hypothetical protein